MSVNAKMTAIADKMREKTGKTEKLNLDQMAETVDEVYDAGNMAGLTDGDAVGYERGRTEGYQTGYAEGETAGEEKGREEGREEGRETGIAEGRQAEWSEFWDAYQKYGKKRNYNAAFYGEGWNNRSTFKPKYPIIISGGTSSHSNMFYNGPSGDLTKILSDAGAYFDTSGVTEFSTMFYVANFTRIPVIDTRGAIKIYDTFQSGNIVTIDGIILRDDGSQTFNSGTFLTSKLVNVSFEGVIGNDIVFKYCTKLSKDSITNIIGVLSTETAGRTVTFSQVAKEAAFTDEEWAAIIATKPNWTISLA